MRAVVGCFTCLWLTAKEDAVKSPLKDLVMSPDQFLLWHIALQRDSIISCAKQTTAQNYRWSHCVWISLLLCVFINLRPWLLLEVAKRITALFDSVRVHFQRKYTREKNCMYCSTLPGIVIPPSMCHVVSRTENQNWNPWQPCKNQYLWNCLLASMA